MPEENPLEKISDSTPIMTSGFKVSKYFDREEFESRLSKNVEYKSTSRSAGLSIKAEKRKNREKS